MTLVDIHNIHRAEGGTLKAKIYGAVLMAAIAVLAEEETHANHANRVTWANAVLADDSGAVAAKAILFQRRIVLQNATIRDAGDAAQDEDVQAAVAALVDTFATGS